MSRTSAFQADRSPQRRRAAGVEEQGGQCKLMTTSDRQPGLSSRNSVTMGIVHEHNVPPRGEPGEQDPAVVRRSQPCTQYNIRGDEDTSPRDPGGAARRSVRRGDPTMRHTYTRADAVCQSRTCAYAAASESQSRAADDVRG